MIHRWLRPRVEEALSWQPAVALLGPRQVGKTTLAHAIGADRPCVYFDLENPEDQAVLAEPRSLFRRHADRLVIVDEVQRAPRMFEAVRGLIDEYRRAEMAAGRFLFLGSASVDLLRQSSESLAGRITYQELGPLSVLEIEQGDAALADRLWLRGGLPDAYLATSDRRSFAWRRDFIRTYLERDIRQFDTRVPSETLRRFWTMLAHQQGGLLNASKLAASLGMDVRTLHRYLDLLVDLLLVRRLQPWFSNVKKRVVRSPKIYVRDSGLVHALLGLTVLEDILGHPVAGASWEGFVIENLLFAAAGWAQPYFYRTSAGAEIDLLLELTPTRRWAIEIKRSRESPRPNRGFYTACADLDVEERFVVYPGERAFRLEDGLEVVPLADMTERVLAAATGRAD